MLTLKDVRQREKCPQLLSHLARFMGKRVYGNDSMGEGLERDSRGTEHQAKGMCGSPRCPFFCSLLSQVGAKWLFVSVDSMSGSDKS